MYVCTYVCIKKYVCISFFIYLFFAFRCPLILPQLASFPTSPPQQQAVYGNGLGGDRSRDTTVVTPPLTHMQIKSQPHTHSTNTNINTNARANITPVRGNLEGFLRSESRAHQSSVLARAAQAGPGAYAVAHQSSPDPFAAPWSNSPRQSPSLASSPASGNGLQYNNNSNRMTSSPHMMNSPRVVSPGSPARSLTSSRPTSPISAASASSKSRHMQRAQSPSPRSSPGGGIGVSGGAGESSYSRGIGSPVGSPTMWRPSLGSDPFEAGTTRTYTGKLRYHPFLSHLY